MAAVHLKKNNYKRTVECCDEALRLDSNNEKAKFRQAQAYIGMGETNKAKNLLTKLQAESKDPTIAKLLADITKGERERELKSKSQLKGFLAKSKKPIYDDDEIKANSPQPSAKITEIDEDELKTSESLGSTLRELKVES